MNLSYLHKSRHETQFHTMFLLKQILMLSTHLHQIGPARNKTYSKQVLLVHMSSSPQLWKTQ